MIITGAGDCGVDEYLDHNLIVPGGTTLNFTVNAKRLFGDSATVRVISAVGTDSFSDIIVRELKREKIENFTTIIPGKTSMQFIDHQVSGEKIFTKYDAGVLENFILSIKDKEILSQSDITMTVIFKQIEKLFDSIIRIKPKKIMMVDFMDLSDYDKSSNIVKKYMDFIDIALFGLNIKDTELLDSLKKLSIKSGKLFIITLGEYGSIAYKGNASFSCTPIPVKKVVDTTGAGDAFAAGFLFEYIKNGDINNALHEGNVVAAKVVQKVGAI